MSKGFSDKFDLSIPRRAYYSSKHGLALCPECRKPLVEDSSTVLITVKSDKIEGQFMSNLTGSHFCASCPVVVFDSDKLREVANVALRGNRNIRYLVEGIVDLDAIPEEKAHLEVGSDDNPVPLVEFLPPLKNTTVTRPKKISRNAPCPCGSGKKYKRCCG